MKLVVVSGTPGAGKTAVILHALRHLGGEHRPAVVKVDCLDTDGHRVYLKRLGVPAIRALAKDMCPDRFAAYNLEHMPRWAESEGADLLVVETAGLCPRCAPYVDACLGVCVAGVTLGPNSPAKVGPFPRTADVVCVNKGDLVSQAEREVLMRRVVGVNPDARVIETNGLTGAGCELLARLTQEEAPEAPDDLSEVRLRERAPLAVCTLCAGETRVAAERHRGILRRIDGFTEYRGE
ncbi:MAG: GTP-binding protein [Euryarchaeota archaeon]